jgi:hypothetical protein
MRIAHLSGSTSIADGRHFCEQVLNGIIQFCVLLAENMIAVICKVASSPGKAEGRTRGFLS